MKQRPIRTGELLAVDPRAVQRDANGLLFLIGAPPPPDNERIGDVAVVHVRGELGHHADEGQDNYDAIVVRVAAALEGEDEGPPKALVLCIDSRGGVVAGLNETVKEIRKAARAAGVATYAYINELAASAAYAMACACDEIAMPRAAIVGSVGTISTMVSCAKADEKAGLDFRLVTSGARKADGHVHAPITDDAIAAEQRHVDAAAQEFFRLVGKVRGLKPAQVEGYEAGLFRGADALAAGLADAILGWDDFLAAVAVEATEQNSLAQPGARAPRSTAQGGATAATPEPDMLALTALIAQTEKALAAEKDEKKRLALSADLAAYKKVKHTVEKHEEESGDDEEGDEDEEAKGNETDRKEGDAPSGDGDGDDDKDGDGDGDDDDEDEEDEEEDEEAKYSAEEEEEAKKASASLAAGLGLASTTAKSLRSALRSALRQAYLRGASRGGRVGAALKKLTGKKSARAALTAVQGRLKAAAEVAPRLAALEQDARRDKRAAMIDAALSARRITRHESKMLATKKLGFVEEYLKMRPKAIIHTSDDALHVPNGDGERVLSADVMKFVNSAVAGSGLTGKAAEALREKLIEANKKSAGASLGANGRI